jgi:hypothetical protein
VVRAGVLFCSPEGQMNFVQIGRVTINSDQVAYWKAYCKEGQSLPTGTPNPPIAPSDEPVIVIHFIGNVEPLSLFLDTAGLFLKFVQANLQIQSIGP